jgi:SnoaL-like domain
MISDSDNKHLAYEFFQRVWAPPHDLEAIDELMTEDYRITTAGKVIRRRSEFTAWVAEMQRMIVDATNERLEVFTMRWVIESYRGGLSVEPITGCLGLLPGRPISFTGIAIWRVENGRLAECWVERSALELYNHLRGT